MAKSNLPPASGMTGRGLPPSQNMLGGAPMGRTDAPNNSLQNNRGLGRPASQASDGLRVNHTMGGFRPGAQAQPSQGDLSHLLPNWPSANPQLRPLDDSGKQQPGS
jgi:hypothetical protein